MRAISHARRHAARHSGVARRSPVPTSQYFGMNTLGARQMRDKLPKEIYAKLVASIRLGKKLDLDIAPAVAHVIKEWALSRGVTHFCHWFQPQTGLTAEKHDAFLALRRKQARRSSSSRATSSSRASPTRRAFRPADCARRGKRAATRRGIRRRRCSSSNRRAPRRCAFRRRSSAITARRSTSSRRCSARATSSRRKRSSCSISSATRARCACSRRSDPSRNIS